MNRLKRIRTFYERKSNIRNIILENVGEDEIIYGASAINKYLPLKLRIYTEDYDIFAINPYAEARQVERALDKYFGGNYFQVKPAEHKGTFRVVSKIDGKVYADYTLTPKKIPYKIINGKRYITLDYAKKDKLRMLRNPKAKFRRSKDKDSLNRMNLAKSFKPKYWGDFDLPKGFRRPSRLKQNAPLGLSFP